MVCQHTTWDANGREVETETGGRTHSHAIKLHRGRRRHPHRSRPWELHTAATPRGRVGARGLSEGHLSGAAISCSRWGEGRGLALSV